MAFVKELRSKFFAEESNLTKGRRRFSAPSRRVASDIGFQIYKDPRFAKNARELARRTHNALRIIGGAQVKGSNFQDCVAVGDDWHWYCSGTLIAENAVLTAGHCACELTATRIFLGNDVERKGKVVRVARQVRHPNYRKGKNNDLMVLVLASAITNIPPRQIAPTELIDRATDGRVVGFGNTDPTGFFGYGIKRQTDVPIASTSCQGDVDGMDDQTVYGCDPNLELIAGKPLLARDTCTGDSGGPMYIEGQDGWLLGGATSRATRGAINNCGDGGVYVRVDRYQNWLQSIVDVKFN